jgi:hypothetical protein
MTCKASLRWYKNGKLHRDGGPAVCQDGGKFWYKNGKRHREDGPAIEWASGNKEWYVNGMLHRTDGPATEYNTGHIGFWVNDTLWTHTEFAAKILDKETAMLWKMSGYCWPFDFGLNK